MRGQNVAPASDWLKRPSLRHWPRCKTNHRCRHQGSINIYLLTPSSRVLLENL